MTATPEPRFAVVGHQENWDQLAEIVRGMRPASLTPVSIEELRTIVPWIPPRTVSRFSVSAGAEGERMDAVFIDTFITPDELIVRPTRRMLDRVRDGIRAAEREGVKVVTLGGFTSILFESDRTEWDSNVATTTGNTLTSALAVKGIERAVSLLGRRLEVEDVLIIGASGDVGSACARALAGRVGKLILTARNSGRLERVGATLAAAGPVSWSTDVNAMLGEATIIIAAASTGEPTFNITRCRENAIICDAGYPKNIVPAAGDNAKRIFWGGLGRIAGGFASADGMLERFYTFPVPHVAHGCILEGAVLALAERYERFSRGRGRISPDAMAEIWRLAECHGVDVAPLFNADGLWPEEQVVRTAQVAARP